MGKLAIPIANGGFEMVDTDAIEYFIDAAAGVCLSKDYKKKV